MPIRSMWDKFGRHGRPDATPPTGGAGVGPARTAETIPTTPTGPRMSRCRRRCLPAGNSRLRHLRQIPGSAPPNRAKVRIPRGAGATAFFGKVSKASTGRVDGGPAIVAKVSKAPARLRERHLRRLRPTTADDRAFGGRMPSLLLRFDLRGGVLDHADDQLEPELPPRDRPERPEGVRPEAVELRGRVEVGDGVL